MSRNRCCATPGCTAHTSTDNKYCKDCRKSVLAEMREKGYLQPHVYGHRGQGRTTDQRENTWETKHGRDG